MSMSTDAYSKALYQESLNRQMADNLRNVLLPAQQQQIAMQPVISQPATYSSPEQIAEAHNKALLYTAQQQTLYGKDPINVESCPVCWDRSRSLMCGCIFNARSDARVCATEIVLESVGSLAIVASTILIVCWLQNRGGFDFSFVSKRDEAITYWIPIIGIGGFTLQGAFHVLYAFGGSPVFVAFQALADAIGLAGDIMLIVKSTDPWIRFLALIFHFVGTGVIQHFFGAILSLGREQRYVMPPASLPSVTGAPHSAGVPFGTPTLAGAPLAFAVAPSAPETAGKDRKKKKKAGSYA